MCGIAGFWAHQGLSDSARPSLKAMTDAIIHRGPDDGGGWFDDACGIALGSRRLAIVDLSPAGHQPMASASGRYVIVYNGEIYNHIDLRLEIDALGDAPAWRGHSDTEVLLAALDRWGIEPTLRRLNGMFAFALWDRQERALYLARDRLAKSRFTMVKREGFSSSDLNSRRCARTPHFRARSTAMPWLFFSVTATCRRPTVSGAGFVNCRLQRTSLSAKTAERWKDPTVIGILARSRNRMPPISCQADRRSRMNWKRSEERRV